MYNFAYLEGIIGLIVEIFILKKRRANNFFKFP